MEDQSMNITSRLLGLNPLVDKEELLPALVPEASQLVFENPYAFCVATCLDHGSKADLIWTIPYWLQQMVGHFDPYRFYQLSEVDLLGLINRLPRKPRFYTSAPRTIFELTRIVVEDFDGDAARIWRGRQAMAVRRTFLQIYGVGPGIANIAVLLLEKAYNVQFSDLDHSRMDIKPDVHTMRVLYRLGVSAAVNEDEAIRAARHLNPSYPGEIDSSLWWLGRHYCSASNPACNLCPMQDLCRKIDVPGG